MIKQVIHDIVTGPAGFAAVMLVTALCVYALVWLRRLFYLWRGLPPHYKMYRRNNGNWRAFHSLSIRDVCWLGYSTRAGAIADAWESWHRDERQRKLKEHGDWILVEEGS